MFQLTESEKLEVVANCDHLNKLKFSPFFPYVFTEHGAVMLASILNSERAINVNVQIVRIYNKMRELLISNKQILLDIEKIKNQLSDHDNKSLQVFKYLNQFEESQQQLIEHNNRPRIGYKS